MISQACREILLEAVVQPNICLLKAVIQSNIYACLKQLDNPIYMLWDASCFLLSKGLFKEQILVGSKVTRKENTQAELA